MVVDVKGVYKQSEVGVIPSDWEVVPITKATNEIFLGLTSKVDYVNNGGIPLVRATDIAEGKLSFDKARTISLEQHKSLTKYRKAKRGDVLVSKSGSLGVCAMVDVDHEFSIYESIIVLQSKPMKLSPSFLLWLMRDERTQIRMIGEKVGSSVAHLNIEMFRRLIVQIPPLTEQAKIATALSDIDELIKSLEKLIAKKRAIKQGASQELLTGKRRLLGFGNRKEGYKLTDLGPISKDWRACRFEDVLMGFSSGMTPFRGKPEYYKGNIPWITSGELNYNVIVDTKEKITEEAMKKTNLKILPKGTFLMAITGLEAAGTRGSCGIVGVEATTNQSCMALYPIKGEITAEYLYHFYVLYGNELALKYCQGTKQQSYTAKIAKLLPINLPPTIDEQNAIATTLSEMDNQIEILETKLAKYKQIKQGMMQSLLTGRVRLV